LQSNQLGKTIRQFRQLHDQTSAQFAAKLGISQRHLMAIETNNRKPSYDLLLQIIKGLHIPADMIFHPESTAPEPEQESVILLIKKCNKEELRLIIKLMRMFIKERGNQ
jgi:transcriptional regulator with XRE-family HTH domain